MVWSNKIIFFFGLLFVASTIMLSRASRTQLQTSSVTIGAGVSDTITLSNYVTFSADSIGLALAVNQDSISGYVRYNYVTPGGYTDTTTIPYMGEAITLLTQEYANFSDAITQKGGADQMIVYLILTNDSYQSKTVRYTLYKNDWK